MDNPIPVFDFNTPWVALIQIALLFLSPQIVGYITDRLSDPKTKVLALGAVSLAGVVLTKLLDIAVTQAWATFNWVDLVNIVVNFVAAWLLSQAVYKTVLKPSGATARAQQSPVVQMFGPEDAWRREERNAA